MTPVRGKNADPNFQTSSFRKEIVVITIHLKPPYAEESYIESRNAGASCKILMSLLLFELSCL